MATPTVELGNYTFKFGVSDYDTPVTVSTDDGSTVRSLELDYRSYEYKFVLIESYGSIFLYFPEVYRLDYEPFRKFRLNFIVGTTDYDGDDYDERDVKYTQVDIDVFAVAFEGDPMIDFVENLRPDIVLERFVSQSPASLLAIPGWGLKNYEFVEKVRKRMEERDARQGKRYCLI